MELPKSETNQKTNIEAHLLHESQIAQAGRDVHQLQYVTTIYNNLSLTNWFRKQAQPSNQQDYRFRKILLNKVKQDWIKGVLEKSLHSKALIELGLQERFDAVERSVSHVLDEPEECDRLLPSGTSASHVFTEMGEGRTLLILGEPGAGKTTILLKLARDLIDQTEQDLSQPIPVIFNLSSWAIKRQPIADWLVQELNSNYQVSKALGKCWIKEQQLLILLDGLDEVKAEYRETCVQALNQFIEQYGQTEMAICSRIRDYEALSARLKLRGSICVQSLTLEQINQYLNQAGEQLEAVKVLIEEDVALQELARSPLMLSVITIAYQSLSSEDLSQENLIEERRNHLFNTYVERMFRRKLTQDQYPKEQAMNWLIWLSHRLVKESLTVFLIERMQPTWLENKIQRTLYKLGSFIIAATVSLLISTIVSITLSLLLMPLILNTSYLSYHLEDILTVLGIAWKKALSEGSIIGLVYGVVILTKQDKIQPIDCLKWSWHEVRNSVKTALLIGLISGLGIGIIKGIYHEVLLRSGSVGVPPVPGVVMGTIAGIVSGAIAGTIYSLIQGFRGAKIQAKSFPNQSIWESAKNACILGILGGLVGGIISIIFAIIFLLLSGDSSSKINALSNAFLGGFVFGTPVGLIFGGIGACIKHFTLRLIIYFSKYIPWNYARFLDYATERVFLQRVGGGYIFIHRMLLEHFAKMEIKS